MRKAFRLEPFQRERERTKVLCRPVLSPLSELLLTLAVFFTASHVHTEAYQYERPLAPASEGSLLFDTATGAPDSDPKRFSVPTSYGAITAELVYFTDSIQVAFALADDHATLTFPTLVNPEALPVTLTFDGIGSMEYEINKSSGEVTLIGHDIADCSQLSESSLYQALVEALDTLEDAFDGPRLVDPSTTDLPVGGIYLLIRYAVMLPDFVADCQRYLNDPLYGVCVVHERYDDCMQCCENHHKVDSVIFYGCTEFLPWPFKLGCVMFLAPHRCGTVICEGKPGDPTPQSCQCPPPPDDPNGQPQPGTCKYACPQAGQHCADCEGDLICCKND